MIIYLNKFSHIENFTMKQALKSAIYYSHDNKNYNKNYNIISEYFYSNQDEFNNIINGFRSDIHIRNVFGNNNNICYEICNNISQDYHDLLIDNLDVLLIITRKDNVIKICKVNDDKDKNNIGIIKIDSVIAELNLTSYNSTSWYKYPLYLGVIGLGLICVSVYHSDKPFDGF